MTDDQSDAAPDPPESLPAYVTNPLERQSADRLGEVIEYASALIDYREQQARRDLEADDPAADDEKIVEIDPNTVGATVVKRVPCGKANCSTCPHGPYKYRVTPTAMVDSGGTTAVRSQKTPTTDQCESYQ